MTFVYFNIGELKDEIFTKKYGFLYKDLQTNQIMQASQIAIFQLRRIIYAIVIVYLPGYNIVQFFVILNSTLLYISFVLHYKPFTDRQS